MGLDVGTEEKFCPRHFGHGIGTQDRTYQSAVSIASATIKNFESSIESETLVLQWTIRPLVLALAHNPSQQ
jgi:hypothetical protein